MQLVFTDSERVLLRQVHYACRGKAGYVPVTVLLMLDHGRAAAAIAQDLGLDESTVHRYAQACQRHGLAALLAKEAPGYAGRLNSTQLLELRAEIGRTLYTDCRQLVDWLTTT
ncbi:MAG: helix-turn-helix domain-containing protein [Janthinobacterium lividum]